MSDTRDLCKVCQRNWSKYTCPRCNLHYCSLDCYKQHGQQCTETFYRESTVQQLEQQYVAGDERNRMLEILQRLHDADASELAEIEANEAQSEDEAGDDADPVLSRELLHKLSMMDNEDKLELQETDLTVEELQAFKQAAATGKLAELVQLWVPWWSLPEAAEVQLSSSGTSKVIAQDTSGDVSKSSLQRLPPAPEEALPVLTSLTKAAPSPLLQWQLLDILYSYAFVMRVYNGEYSTDAQEAASTLLQVSGVLASAANSRKAQPKNKSHAAVAPTDIAATPGLPVLPQTASEAVNGCMERVCSPAIASGAGPATAVALLQDLARLLQLGRSGTMLALNDVQLLFKASMHALSAVGTSKTDLSSKQSVGQAGSKEVPKSQQAQDRHVNNYHKQVKNQYSLVLHKLLFMLAWANELPDSVYNSLFDAVLQEVQEHSLVAGSKEPSSVLNLQPESFVGSMLQANKVQQQQKPVIQTL